MIRAVLVAVVAAALMSGAGSAFGDESSKKPKQHKQHRQFREVQVSGCPSAKRAVRFYQGMYVHHLGSMGREVDVEFEHPQACERARFLADRWKQKAANVRETSVKWRYTLRDFVVRDGNRAWERAVQEVQRVYPGTSGWLLSCSASEGGHGRWVAYGGGPYYEGYSGVGGWLQFMPGTFWRMFDAAQEDMAQRRFNVPASAASWLSPLGQALAGAWGVTNGRSHEWAGYGCRW